MNITICSRIAQKELRQASRNAKRNNERIELLKQIQIDSFSQYKYDKSAPSLESLVMDAQSYSKDSDERIRILHKIMRYHGGLGAKIGHTFRNSLEYGEVMGYLWESIIKLPETWNPSKGKASTCLRMICSSMIWKKVYHEHYVGTVRTPLRSKKFTSTPLNTDQELIKVSEIDIDSPVYQSMLVNILGINCQ